MSHTPGAHDVTIDFWVETRTAFSRVKDLCLFDQCLHPLLLSMRLYNFLTHYLTSSFALLITLANSGCLTINVTTVCLQSQPVGLISL